MEDTEEIAAKKVQKDVEDDEEDEAPKGPSAFSRWLNRFFHHLDRGGSLGGEVGAGIVMFLLSFALLFANLQIITAASNGALTLSTSPKDAGNIAASLSYVRLYEASILIAFVGSLLMGLLARLPFLQIALLGLGTSLISLVGTGTGLSYQNILFLDFISALIYAIVVGVPFLRHLFTHALPEPLRKMLPALSGVLLISVALRLSGLLKTATVSLGELGGLSVLTITGFGNSLTGLGSLAFILALVMGAGYGLFRLLKLKHPFLLSFGLASIAFLGLAYLFGGADTTSENSLINLGRVWLFMGSSKEVATPYADSYLTYRDAGWGEIFAHCGELFSKGADFSAYKGNVLSLAFGAVLSFLLLSFYDVEAALRSIVPSLNETVIAGAEVDGNDDKSLRKLYYVNAGINLVAPFLGLGNVLVDKASVAGVKDRAKSGLAPIVAALLYLLSLFAWVVPVLLATHVYAVTSMNQWNYFAYGNGGFVYLVQGVQFGLADAALVLVGIGMVVTSFQSVDCQKKENAISFVILILAGIFFNSFVAALAFALTAYEAMVLFASAKPGEKKGFGAWAKEVKEQAKKLGWSSFVLEGLLLVATFAQ